MRTAASRTAAIAFVACLVTACASSSPETTTTTAAPASTTSAAVTTTPLAILEDLSGKVAAVAWSPDGTHLATGSNATEGNTMADRNRATVKVWDVTTLETVFSLDQVEVAISEIAFNPEGTIIAARPFAPTLFDARTGDALPGQPDFFEFRAFSPDGTLIAVGGNWGWTAVVDAATGANLFEPPPCPGPNAFVRAAAWSPSGIRLAATCQSSVRIWDLATGDQLPTIVDDVEVGDVEWSPDGTRIATASSIGTAKIWDAATGDELAALGGHSEGGGTLAVAWSPDGTRLATAGNDGTARIWSAITFGEVSTLVGHTAEVTDVAWSPDGTRLATAGNDGTVRIWNAER